MNHKGTLFIIAAASGTGKTTLANALAKAMPNIKISISHTTRPIRPIEQNDSSYFFVDEKEFKNMVENNMFLECANVFGNYYGTSRDWVLKTLNAGYDIVLDIDWQGAKDIRQIMPNNTVSIFLLPPSREILKKRLAERNSDNAEVIMNRIAKASNEISHYNEFDYIVINDDFTRALDDLCAIIKAKRLECATQAKKHSELLADLL